MSGKFFTALSIGLLFCLSFVKSAYAIEDPFINPNNKIGIHILFTTEVQNAAKLINSSGGDWGYVTIPIQSTDHDLKKWQQFMNNCKKYHVIPIVRLATASDSNDSTVWKKPHLTDVIEIASFLSKLSWPTENRYVIIYNEVNRADEWGGAANASEYANILSFAVTVFKSKSPDFFIISAGLDNAAPNQGTNYINQYAFMRQMNDAIPGIFHQIDGLASHSYPNPGFSQSPSTESMTGVASFAHERTLAKVLTGKTLPVFITETGWSEETVSTVLRDKYYHDTFATIWNDPGIVAITPFILEARSPEFAKFSFLTATGSSTPQYQTLYKLTKTKGVPSIPAKVLAAETSRADELNSDGSITPENTGFFLTNMVQRVLNVFKN